jgi:hypothetical protein
VSVLADRDIRAELEAGRIRIEPYDPDDLQPSSVDLHLDRSFRVFRNNRYAFIDPREAQPDLTELLGVRDDEPFILHPGEFVLGQTIEWVELPTDLVARLEGKALAVDTPVPTPLGWRTMGDLVPGDTVFDEAGAPTAVIAVTPPMLGRPCREVCFSDGTRVVADASHQWMTVDKNGRRYGRVRAAIRTTDQIAQTLSVRDERNHHVPLAGPAQYPPRLDLPIEPYTLGAWLGDGTTTKAEITCCDTEILAQISGDGFSVRRLAYAPHLYRIGEAGHSRDEATGRYSRNGSLSSRLRNLGMLDGKYVPRPYLEAGTGQRMALLQGLMDTDGFVDDVAGRCEFTSTNEGLADAVVELAASLGFRPVKSEGRAMLDGVDHGPKYRVKFTPDRPVFRIARKLVRQKAADAHFHRFRAIADVREVGARALHRGRIAARAVPRVTLVHPYPQQLSWPSRPPHPFHRRLRGSRLEGDAHARAEQRGQPPHRPLRRDADRADQLLPHVEPGRAPLRHLRARVEVPGAEPADGLGVPPRLRGPPQASREG